MAASPLLAACVAAIFTAGLLRGVSAFWGPVYQESACYGSSFQYTFLSPVCSGRVGNTQEGVIAIDSINVAVKPSSLDCPAELNETTAYRHSQCCYPDEDQDCSTVFSSQVSQNFEDYYRPCSGQISCSRRVDRYQLPSSCSSSTYMPFTNYMWIDYHCVEADADQRLNITCSPPTVVTTSTTTTFSTPPPVIDKPVEIDDDFGPTFEDNACYGSTPDNFLTPSCVGRESGASVVMLKDVMAGSKRLSLGCPEEVNSTTEYDPIECCSKDRSLDCIFDFPTSTFYELCSGSRTGCNLRVDRARLQETCRVTDFMAFTNYMAVAYHCLKESSIVEMCSREQTYTGPAGFLWNKDYNSEMDPFDTDCSGCSVQACHGSGSISVFAIHLTLERDPRSVDCKQRILIKDGNHGTVPVDCDVSTGYSVKHLYTSISSHLTVTMENTLSREGGNFWLYFRPTDMTGTLTISCPAVDPASSCPVTTPSTTPVPVTSSSTSFTSTTNTATTTATTTLSSSTTQSTSSPSTASSSTSTTESSSTSSSVSTSTVTSEPTTVTENQGDPDTLKDGKSIVDQAYFVPTVIGVAILLVIGVMAAILYYVRRTPQRPVDDHYDKIGRRGENPRYDNNGVVRPTPRVPSRVPGDVPRYPVDMGSGGSWNDTDSAYVSVEGRFDG